MAGTARNLDQARMRERQARRQAESQARNATRDEDAYALTTDVAAPLAPAQKAAPRRTTRDGRFIDGWRQLPPHVRQGWIGTAMVTIGLFSYAGLLAGADSASPIAPIGQAWHALAGVGAFPVVVLVVVGGAVQIAEALARRRLLRPYLFALALTLLFVVLAMLQLFVGHGAGGNVGAALASLLNRLPGWAARGIVVVMAMALALALAGMGGREAARMVVRTTRSLFTSAPSLVRARKGMQQTSSQPRAPRDELAGQTTPLETAVEAVTPQPVPTLLLPTAGFPMLDAGRDEWALPPLDLFDAPTLAAPFSAAATGELVIRLQRALATLGLAGEVRREDISVGPTIIRLGIRPAERPRRDARGYVLVGRDGQPLMERAPVGEILRAQRDLAAALGVRRLRLEAPTTGQPVVGVEIPRPDPRGVGVYEVLLGDAFQQMSATTALALALGRDVRGQARALDLAAAPHLLLAGAVGTGAQTTLQALLASLLACATPDDARLLLIDPSRTLLPAYDDVPHLLMPVVTEPGGALSALRRVIEEAERRFQLFAQVGVRNMEAYQHLASQDAQLEWLPALVVAIAELADLAAAGESVGQTLAHLAHLGRATGIHLVVATEHPGPASLPATLTAQIPVRLAFAVPLSVDSRAILDAPGAESLVGRGDALLLAGDAGRAERIQAAAASAEEVSRLARFWRRQVTSPLTSTPISPPAPSPAQRQPFAAAPRSAPRAQSAAFGSAQPADDVAQVLPPLPRRGGARGLAPEESPALQPGFGRDVVMARGGAPRGGARRTADEWDAPLPEGWTDEMLEDMMQQIRAVIAQGRPTRAPAPSTALSDEE